MGSASSKYTQIREDGHYILVKYRKNRSNPHYVAMVVINSKKYKKDFKNREDADKWLKEMEKYKIEDNMFFQGMY